MATQKQTAQKNATLWEQYSEQEKYNAVERVEAYRDAWVEASTMEERQKANAALVEDFIGYWGSHQPMVIKLTNQLLDCFGERSLYETAKFLVDLRALVRQTVAN